MKILYPWCVVGEYEDGTRIEMGGNSFGECIGRLCDREPKYGRLVWYGGLNDWDLGYVDGERIRW